MELEPALFHRLAHSGQAVLAKAVVHPQHRNARHTEGCEVLHQLLGLVAVAGADVENMIEPGCAHQFGAGEGRNQRHGRIVLGQHRQDGCHVGRAREVAQGKDAILGDHLDHVLHGVVGLVAIVQRDHTDASAMHAALGVHGVEKYLGRIDHIGCHFGQRAAQIQGLAEHDFIVRNTRAGSMERAPGRQRGSTQCTQKSPLLQHVSLLDSAATDFRISTEKPSQCARSQCNFQHLSFA